MSRDEEAELMFPDDEVTHRHLDDGAELGLEAVLAIPDGPEVGKLGGTVDKLYFAVVGDTRPSMPNSTGGYPETIITRIYETINGMTPRPQFAVGTGDYGFATSGSQSGPKQHTMYRNATAKFEGTVFAAMGNHECKTSTATNCTDPSINKTYNSYLETMVKPLGQPKPYYTINVNATDGSWTSKLVFLACNAWDNVQAAWFEQEMKKPTTHTFVVRHQPTAADRGPCVPETGAVLSRSDYTLLITGHEHTFSRPGLREIVVGTGGAPLDGDIPYGYATVEQVAEGFRVSAYDYTTALPFESFVVPFGRR